MREMLRVIAAYRRAVVVGLVCGAVLGVVSVAWATEHQTSSDFVYTPYIDGHIYDSQSIIYTGEAGSPSDWASTGVFTEEDHNVPPGWMAADARKFISGNLCEQSGWELNSTSTFYEVAFAQSVPCGSGVYYSYGFFNVWNGNGYNDYYSGLSPSLNG